MATLAGVAVSAIGAIAQHNQAKHSGGAGKPTVVPTHWTKQGTDTVNEQASTVGYAPAMSGVDQSLMDAQNLYNNAQGFTPQQLQALNNQQNLAIQRGGDSQWLTPGAQLASHGVAGDLGIGANNINSYTAALNNNQAINNQMAALELNSSRRLREQLVPEIRGSFDAAGMYNSGLAQQAEQRAARDVAESLNAQELGFRGNQYARDQALAAQQLGGNRDYQTKAGAALADYGQQGLQNLQQAGTAQYTYDQNVLDNQYDNQVGQGQYGWKQLGYLQDATLPAAQAFASKTGSTTNNYNQYGDQDQVTGGGGGAVQGGGSLGGGILSSVANTLLGSSNGQAGLNNTGAADLARRVGNIFYPASSNQPVELNALRGLR